MLKTGSTCTGSRVDTKFRDTKFHVISQKSSQPTWKYRKISRSERKCHDIIKNKTVMKCNFNIQYSMLNMNMSIWWTGSGSRSKSYETTVKICKTQVVLGQICGLDPVHVQNQMRQYKLFASGHAKKCQMQQTFYL
jgi:hypothetical protein